MERVCSSRKDQTENCSAPIPVTHLPSVNFSLFSTKRERNVICGPLAEETGRCISTMFSLILLLQLLFIVIDGFYHRTYKQLLLGPSLEFLSYLFPSFIILSTNFLSRSPLLHESSWIGFSFIYIILYPPIFTALLPLDGIILYFFFFFIYTMCPNGQFVLAIHGGYPGRALTGDLLKTQII